VSQSDVKNLREKAVRRCSAGPWGEEAAVAVLLGFDRIAGDRRFWMHVDQAGVDFDPILADDTWSTTERFLIATCACLWNSRHGPVDIGQVYSLDSTFWQVWHDMVTAARTGRVPAGTGEGSGS